MRQIGLFKYKHVSRTNIYYPCLSGVVPLVHKIPISSVFSSLEYGSDIRDKKICAGCRMEGQPDDTCALPAETLKLALEK